MLQADVPDVAGNTPDGTEELRQPHWIQEGGLQSASSDWPEKPPLSELNFINFTRPNENREPSNRRAIRTHVLRNYHAQRRSAANSDKRASSRTLAPLRPQPLSRQSVPHTRINSNPLDTSLSAERIDPFSTLPINLSPTDHYFVDQC